MNSTKESPRMSRAELRAFRSGHLSATVLMGLIGSHVARYEWPYWIPITISGFVALIQLVHWLGQREVERFLVVEKDNAV